MHSLTIAMGTMAWSLLFKTAEAAQSARDRLAAQPGEPPAAFGYGAGACITIADDFGQEVSIWPGRISGFLLENLEQSKHAHIARALHNTRTEVLGRQAAGSDPIIQQAQNPRGPGIISPMGNGRLV